MQLWREQDDNRGPVTRDEQEHAFAEEGADLNVPVMTISWQEFLATRLNFSSISTLTLDPVAVTAPVPARLTATTTLVDAEGRTIAITTIMCSTTPLPPSVLNRPM
jgi:hypothetical protein